MMWPHFLLSEGCEPMMWPQFLLTEGCEPMMWPHFLLSEGCELMSSTHTLPPLLAAGELQAKHFEFPVTLGLTFVHQEMDFIIWHTWQMYTKPTFMLRIWSNICMWLCGSAIDQSHTNVSIVLRPVLYIHHRSGTESTPAEYNTSWTTWRCWWRMKAFRILFTSKRMGGLSLWDTAF